MKRPVKFLSKAALAIAVFAQTSTADTGFTLLDNSSFNEPLYLTLCGLGLMLLGIKSRSSI